MKSSLLMFEQRPRLLEPLDDLVGPLLRRHAVGLGRSLHLEPVLVGAGEEERVVAEQPMPARDGVGRHGRVGVPDVGRVVDVVDGCRQVDATHGRHLRGARFRDRSVPRSGCRSRCLLEQRARAGCPGPNNRDPDSASLRASAAAPGGHPHEGGDGDGVLGHERQGYKALTSRSTGVSGSSWSSGRPAPAAPAAYGWPRSRRARFSSWRRRVVANSS